MPRSIYKNGKKREMTVPWVPHFSIAHSSPVDFLWMFDCLADSCIPHKLNSLCLSSISKSLWETEVSSFVIPGPAFSAFFFFFFHLICNFWAFNDWIVSKVKGDVFVCISWDILFFAAVFNGHLKTSSNNIQICTWIRGDKWMCSDMKCHLYGKLSLFFLNFPSLIWNPYLAHTSVCLFVLSYLLFWLHRIKKFLKI